MFYNYHFIKHAPDVNPDPKVLKINVSPSFNLQKIVNFINRFARFFQDCFNVGGAKVSPIQNSKKFMVYPPHGLW